MYQIKQIPEDFVVKEIPDFKLVDFGEHSIFLMTKKDYTTEKAIQTICNKLNLRRNRVGCAGNKDKKAVTEQYISIERLGKKIESLKIKDIKLKFMGFSNEPISLGDLKENCFEIVVRNLIKSSKIKPIKFIPNYFDQQRFSNNNVGTGRFIVKKDFEKAIENVLINEGDYERRIKEYLEKNNKDFIGALRKIPSKILILFIHAYQSFIFNETITEYLKLKHEENIKIPIVGFGTEYDNKEIEKIIKKIIERESLTERDFIIPEIPYLSSEGNERDLFVKVKGLHVGKLEADELNKNKYKTKIFFSLPKGSYATYVIKELF